MAKKKDVPGIYKRRGANRISAKDDPKGFRAALDDWVKLGQMSADDYLLDVRQGLADFLKQFLDGPIDAKEARNPSGGPRAICNLHLDGEKKLYSLAADAPEAARDAIDAMHELDVLKYQLGRNQGVDMAMFLKSAIRLGALQERIAVREFEPLVRIGVRAKERSAKGAEKTNEQHIALQSRYQPLVDKKMTEGYSYTEATESIAASLGVSGRTVRNHTMNADTE